MVQNATAMPRAVGQQGAQMYALGSQRRTAAVLQRRFT